MMGSDENRGERRLDVDECYSLDLNEYESSSEASLGQELQDQWKVDKSSEDGSFFRSIQTT